MFSQPVSRDYWFRLGLAHIATGILILLSLGRLQLFWTTSVLMKRLEKFSRDQVAEVEAECEKWSKR